MKIKIMSKNYQVSEKLAQIITEKVAKLDRYFEASASAKVVCSKIKDTYKLELTIVDKGLLFRSEVSSDNMYQNIDLALPKVERQIVKYSTKLQDKLRKSSSIKGLLFNDDELDFHPEECRVSRSKNFVIYPLTEAEAIMELENSDHSFYVFLNVATRKVNIIYKRFEGDYGIIEPDYE